MTRALARRAHQALAALAGSGRRFARALARAAREHAADVLGGAGVAALLRGAWLIYPPAAWLLGGVLGLVAATLVARQERSGGRP